MSRRGALAAGVLAVALGGCSASGSGSSPAGKGTVPPLRAGWKTVSHEGFAVDVPDTWSVERWQPTCGVQSPTVYLGPEGLLPRCSSTAPGAEVVIGAYSHPAGRVKTTINGLTAYVSKTEVPYSGTPTSATITEAWVEMVGKTSLGLYFAIPESTSLPGGAPGLANELIDTIHEVR